MDYGVTRLKRSIKGQSWSSVCFPLYNQGVVDVCEVSDLLVVFRLLSTSVSMGFDIT